MEGEIIEGQPFCKKCGEIMICTDGVSFECKNPECNKQKKPKKEKKYRCKECKKEYSTFGWVERHVIRTGHRKFKKINSKFKFKVE